MVIPTEVQRENRWFRRHLLALFVISLTLLPLSTPALGNVPLRDDFNGSEGQPLDSLLWSVTIGGMGHPSQVYQSGDGWAHVDVASDWTGLEFYTNQTFANTGQYHIEGRLTFTVGTNVDHVWMLIRNPNETCARGEGYNEYNGPQIMLSINTVGSLVHMMWLNGNYPADATPGYAYATPALSFSGTNTMVMSVDYNAGTGQTVFDLWNSDKSILLTEASKILGTDVLDAIGPTFRVAMGMDGHGSYDSYWDYVEVTPEPATLSLLAVGIGGLMLGRRRR